MNVTAMFIALTARACKTVYPGSIPGVASSFAAAQFRLGDPSPEGRCAIARRGGLEKRLSLPFRRF